MEIGVNGEQQFVTLITYVVVDKDDPGFQNPTKPIGPFYTQEQASSLAYTMKETDKGLRRVVASPKPVTIVEHREIKKLIELDFIVICCGGGGIPVVRKNRKFRGVEAVIDKDLASSILAQEIKADIFVIASDVKGAGINWSKSDQKMLRKVPLAEMDKYVKEGQFPAGSMGPKVEALMQFFKATGNRGIICQLDDIEKAIAGEAGTEIIK
jgi:carbamate kinase